MPDSQTEIDAKLAALQSLQAAGVRPRVAELVRVGWPQPDGPIYYATALAADLLDSADLLAQLDGPIELRLPGNAFLDITHDSGIADDKVDLDFSDLDDEMARLFLTYGEGARVEAFYWFPDVELLFSEWWGHLRPPDQADRERIKASAESGFMSAMLPLPRRAFFTSCQAMFGGLLKTQEEIDEGDCPYSLHLEGTVGTRFATDATWLQSQTFVLGWQNPGFDDSGWSVAVDEGAIGLAPWGTTQVFPPGSNPHWIWYHDSRSTPYGADAITLYFRKSFTADQASALLTVAADDSFVAYLDGAVILSGSDWHQSYTSRMTLVPGQVYTLAFSVSNIGGPAGLAADIAFGIQGLSRGNLDPATGLPYPSCPRNNRQVCIDRLEPGGSTQAPSYLAFDTIIESYVVHETKGPNITVNSRGNENFLKRPLRVVFGKRHVTDMDILAYTVEPDTNHPDQGSARVLSAACEGPIQSMTNCKVNGNVIGAQHLNVMLGEKRQPRTSFSANVNNYSGTALFNAVTQGDFTKVVQTPGAQTGFQSEADIEGLRDVRIYTDETSFTEQYSMDRAWALLHVERNKRWGQGVDVKRFVIQDFIDLSRWFAETVSIVDSAGIRSTGPRSTFNAELIDRNAQQQINDICSAGRVGLPFPDKGKMRVLPLRRATELFSSSIFVDRAYWAVFDRAATDLESTLAKADLEAARTLGNVELLAEGVSQLDALFNDSEYAARARTDEEFVADLYQAFFNHAGDVDGSAFWLNQVTVSGRPAVLNAFGDSDEFALRMSDQTVPTFTDIDTAESERNICVDQNQKTTLSWSKQADDTLPNRWLVTFDDAANNNQQTPLIFEDPEQQLAAGRAFGDFTRRAVEREYSAFGVTDAGEAARLGNTLLALGELDEGGTENNLRITFTTWWSYAVALHKYQIIKIVSVDKFHNHGFQYFRIRSIRRQPDLKVEISAQAYPVSYYEQLELITTPPFNPFVPPFIPPSPFDPNPGGGGRQTPRGVGFEDLTHSDDRISFTLEVLEA